MARALDVVLGQPVHHRFQRHDSRRGNDAGLPHACRLDALRMLAEPCDMNSSDPHSTDPTGHESPFGEAECYCSRKGSVSSCTSTPKSYRRVEKPCPVQM